MKSEIQFASRAEMEQARRLHPVTTPRTKPAYNDLVLNPDYQSRKFTFPKGQTCIRILPGIKGSPYWMQDIHVLTHPNGQHLHPKSLTPKARSVFDIAYGWLRTHKPETLYNKTNPEGFRLLPTAMGISWVLVEIDGEMKPMLFFGSSYAGGPDGSNCGVAHQLYRVASAIKQPGGHDAADAEDGVQIIVEKSTPQRGKYTVYKMSRGSVAVPISRYLERLSETENNAICPLRQVLRTIEADEEWELLANVVGVELRDEIRNATANTKTQVTPKAQPQPVEQTINEPSPVSEGEPHADDELSVTGDDDWRW
jgi:hypothetical protein